MAAIPIIATVASSVISMGADAQKANVTRQAAQYNAAIDITNAQQLAMDANANVQKQRKDDASYLSSQRAAYAASGILSGTGSPMVVQATTAGRMEQNIQQYWTATQERENTLYAAAAEGVFEGDATASSYDLQAGAEIFKAIGSVNHLSNG